jgi:hypothetical protein
LRKRDPTLYIGKGFALNKEIDTIIYLNKKKIRRVKKKLGRLQLNIVKRVGSAKPHIYSHFWKTTFEEKYS